MRFGYVVLYVEDVVACRRFWVEQVGMVERRCDEVGAHIVAEVGFAGEDASLELVPLALMRDNPDGLDLATPSICFRVGDLDAARADLVSRGVEATQIGAHGGRRSFGFSDPEGRWFAVTG